MLTKHYQDTHKNNSYNITALKIVDIDEKIAKRSSKNEDNIFTYLEDDMLTPQVLSKNKLQPLLQWMD